MSPAGDTQVHRDLGRMEAQIEALETRMEAMQKQVADMHQVVMQARGSWRALVGVAGFSAFLTGIGIKLLSLSGMLR